MVTQARLLESAGERANESALAARGLESYVFVTTKLSTLVDAFTTQVSATLWPGAKNAVWDAGRARFAIDGNYNGLRTDVAGAYDLTGSSIYLKATLPPMGANSEFVLELRPPFGDTNNRLYFRVGEATTEIQAQRVDGGSYTFVGGAPYSPTNHAWMRISEAGGTLTYATSADGLAWNTLGTIAAPSWSLSRVFVTIGGGDWSATAGDCFIDNVNVAFNPEFISGLTVWLDAVDYTSGESPVWPNKGSGAAVSIEGAPPMSVSANTLNGLPLVKFIGGGGRVRGGWPTAPHDYTLLYLVRWVGVATGRAFTAQYPPSNMLIGMHTSAKDAMYDNGVWIYGPEGQGWWSPPPGPWRMYEADSSSTVGARFFIDGVLAGAHDDSANTAQGGLTGGWGLSGYGAAEQETMDIEVAEMVIYDRKLTDAERIQVEDYLNDKWFPAPAAALYADDFNRANAALTTPWMHIDGSHSIVSNKVAVGPASPNNSYYDATFSADQWAEADLDNEQDGAGVIFPIVRCGTGANADLYYYWVGPPGSRQFQINKRLGGVYSTVASAGGPMPTGPFKARLEVQGTTLRGYADGVLVVTGTDATVATGRPGMLSANGTGGTLDNWRCGDLPYPGASITASTQALVADATTGTINKPTCVAGDTLLWIIATSQPFTGPGNTAVPAASAGTWTKLGGPVELDPTHLTGMSIYTHTVTGSEGATFTSEAPVSVDHSLMMLTLRGAASVTLNTILAVYNNSGPLVLPGIAVPTGGIGLAVASSFYGFGNADPPGSGPWTVLYNYDPSVLLQFTGTGTSPSVSIPFGGGDTHGVQISVAPT